MKAKQIGLIRNKNKKDPLFISYLMLIWSLLMIVALLVTLLTPKKVENRYYEEQIASATLAKTAMEKIKERKIELGISFPKEDVYQSGMIGEWFSDITTTSGMIGAKRTAINPDFAAVYIDMFREAGLKKGDQIALVVSSSFPTLNISALAAIQVYELDACVMASIGSSTYGANNVDFTFFDMAEYLYNEGILTTRIDYVSFGGANDDGYEFPEEVRKSILDRINKSGVEFLCESDFEKNIKMRTDLILNECPDIKMLISVGGTLVAMGEGDTGSTLYRGLVQPTYLRTNKKVNDSKYGLLDTFLNRGVPVIQMLNIKGIALDYGVSYDPDVMPQIGTCDAYYEVSYNIDIPIISICLSLGLLVAYFVYQKKKIKGE